MGLAASFVQSLGKYRRPCQVEPYPNPRTPCRTNNTAEKSPTERRSSACCSVEGTSSTPMAVRIRNLYIFQPVRNHLSNRRVAYCRASTAGCGLPAVECSTLSHFTRGTLFPFHSGWNTSDCTGSHADRRLRRSARRDTYHRRATYTLPKRTVCRIHHVDVCSCSRNSSTCSLRSCLW